MKVTILCSGFGLGFYTPGLLIESGLHRLGISTAVHVFENVLPESARTKVDENRKAYHDNFKIALMSQKIPQDISESLDSEALEQLLSVWCEDDRRHFICLSGHWMYVLEEYRLRRNGAPLHIELLYMDSTLSPSWKNLARYRPQFAAGCGQLTLFDRSAGRINGYIDVPVPVVPYSKREQRLFVHGGGWGMGTYRDKLDELEGAGYALDLILYNDDAPDVQSGSRRYYRMDPQWRTWQTGADGRHMFPPFAEVKPDEETIYRNQGEYHLVYGRQCRMKGIVSKPGGGTLTDSFASATPLIMLEPFGAHEQDNADLWEELGFGIRYERWISEYGGSTDIFEPMHKAMLEMKERTPDCAGLLAQRLGLHSAQTVPDVREGSE
ncbi:UDP-glucuronosyltransferase [Paenibacillus sp. P96]|uniref:UDP-glucuronosyltransferase n=1 Tax=Paenibacillus zeirhizosphaerae TaxID=2987519 RepID=A0ABT9FMS2_9BACL|nr:UDP-glucuronosyltransferase [Paenibacillus sp. P96]MDP4095712.1 UDP-glucuronosyltransferase [Paenibacillus sp. P96]